MTTQLQGAVRFRFRLLLTISAAAALFAIPASGARAQEDRPSGASGITETEFEQLEIEAQMNARQISAAQAIADRERDRLDHSQSLGRRNIDNLESFEYTLRGETEPDILREAGVRALVSTAARLYFDGYVLLGRELLEPYLNIYGDRFIARRTVLNKRIISGGGLEATVRIGVDVDMFLRDLDQKHFLARPNYRPIMAVAVAESIDGKATTDGRGRRIMEDTLRKLELRVESERMGSFPLTASAISDEEAMKAALIEAQRGGVEILITGTLEVTSAGIREILFDRYIFYEAEARLSLIRVDTGETLASSRQRYAASAPGVSEALDETFTGLMPRVSAELSEDFQRDWENTMLDGGDFRLLVAGTSREDLEGIFNVLRTYSTDLRTYTRSFFGDVAVVNVVAPGADAESFERHLRRSRLPQFLVRRLGDRKYELKLN